MQKCIVLYNLEELYIEFKRFKWSRWRLLPNICYKQWMTLERKSENIKWFHTNNKFIISLLTRHYYTSKYQIKHFINLKESFTRWKVLNRFYRKLLFYSSGDSPRFSFGEILNALYTHCCVFFFFSLETIWYHESELLLHFRLIET